MEKTTRDIPDAVYDRARDLQDSGLYEAAFEYVAAWARNEALRYVIENVVSAMDPEGVPATDVRGWIRARSEIEEALSDMLKEHVTIPNPDHTPLGKYEVID